MEAAFGVRRSACGVCLAGYRFLCLLVSATCRHIRVISDHATPNAERRTPNCLFLACFLCTHVWSADTTSSAPPFLSTISGEVIHANTIELPHLTLSDVVAFPVMTGQVLRLSDVRAQAYGGTVTGSVSVDLHDLQSQTVTVQLVMANIDLALLSSALSASVADIAGKLNGTLDLTIITDHPERMVGHGSITIRDATLVNTSWFASMLMGDLGKNQGHDSAVAQFDIGNGQWVINELQIQMAKAQMNMQGTISFDGDMNLQVSPHFGSFLGLVPVLGRLFDRATGAVTSRFARGVLRGPVSKPVWIYRPFGE